MKNTINCEGCSAAKGNWIPKIVNDYVYLKSVKQSWNREEVIELIKKFDGDFVPGCIKGNQSIQDKRIADWLKENIGD